MKTLLNKDLSKGVESILMVDDDPVILHFCRILLESAGYTVTTEFCPEAALSHFTESPRDYDLVITDYEMRPLNGEEFASAIAKIRPEIPVIAYTGTPLQGRQAGVFKGMINKPASPKNFIATIRRVIDFECKKDSNENIIDN